MPEPSTSSNSLFSKTWNDADEEVGVYSRLSIPALLSFLFAAASFLVFFSIWFFFLSLLGIALALVAIVTIRRSEGGLTGLALAQLGLCLSIVSLVAVSVLWPSYHYGVRREADHFFRIWFEALREDNIPQAKGLQSYYWGRPQHEDREKWWHSQYENKFSHRDIHNYVENDLLRVLLALGSKAEVSRYQFLSTVSQDSKDAVVAVYAVTYPTEDGKTETFFVKMSGEREYPTGDATSAGWRLSRMPEFYLPPEFQEAAKTPAPLPH